MPRKFFLTIEAHQKARRPGCCTWHPEALVPSLMRREKTPRLILRRLSRGVGLSLILAEVCARPAP